MLGEPTTFWGKHTPANDNGGPEWHPLIDHCADVASVVEALVILPVWRRRLTRLAGQDVGDVGWSRLCVLAALHDIGKLNIGFQAKCRSDLGPPTGHVTVALGALFRPTFSCLKALAAWGGGATRLLKTAICHHGRPYTDAPWQNTWWQPRAGLDPRAGAEKLLACCRTWFPVAFEAHDSELPDTAAFSHAFAGLVMLADWIGSDTQFFPFSTPDDGDRICIARRAAHIAVSKMALDVGQQDRDDASGREPFTRIAPPGYVPRPAQTALLTVPHDEQGSITVLEAETGSGKTEAALAHFVHLFEAGLVDGLYLALPTRTAATQMHQRVHAAMQRAFAHPPAVVLAVPGYLRVDHVEGERLPPFTVLWPEHDRFRYRAWAAENAKRYLVGCVVVGTIDQVLLSSLMVGHAHLRATSLLRHLLVVDEVHASDAYMARILEDVLERHQAAGGHALLLSATLGSETRTRLLHPGEQVRPPTLADAKAAPYPLITHRTKDERTIAVPRDDARRVVEIAMSPWMETPATLATEAVTAAGRGAKVLVIRNTVRNCLATQEAIERAVGAQDGPDVLFACAGHPAPHHARFARADRRALDDELEARFGKDRPEGGCVVVATQTAQQSLDLDADRLFSDLCPADVLLQRLGRLHRHPRPRPDGFERPQAVVMVPDDRDLGVLLGDTGEARNHHGLGSVYPDLRILEATWRLLEMHQEWHIPRMNRELIEHSVHSSVLDGIAADGGPRWQAHATHICGSQLGVARLAHLNLVDRSRPYDEMSFPDPRDDAPIVTRLGEGDRRVRFEPCVTGPFRHAVRELLLRAAWVRGVPSDIEVAEDVTSADGVTCFRFGEHVFRYDWHGLRPTTERAEVLTANGP